METKRLAPTEDATSEQTDLVYELDPDMRSFKVNSCLLVGITPFFLLALIFFVAVTPSIIKHSPFLWFLNAAWFAFCGIFGAFGLFEAFAKMTSRGPRWEIDMKHEIIRCIKENGVELYSFGSIKSLEWDKSDFWGFMTTTLHVTNTSGPVIQIGPTPHITEAMVTSMLTSIGDGPKKTRELKKILEEFGLPMTNLHHWHKVNDGDLNNTHRYIKIIDLDPVGSVHVFRMNSTGRWLHDVL